MSAGKHAPSYQPALGADNLTEANLKKRYVLLTFSHPFILLLAKYFKKVALESLGMVTERPQELPKESVEGRRKCSQHRLLLPSG